MGTKRRPRAFLIDGHSFCYRAFYAIRDLRTSDGRPTNAVYGVVTMLQSLLEKERPDHAAVAFDAGKPTFRHAQYAEYKIHRRPMPQPLVEQLPVIKEVLQAYRLPLYELEGYEADDLLATMAMQLVKQGDDVYLVTGDKDALQLVGPHISVYHTQKEGLIIDEAGVKERYGVTPQRMTDLMALMGDATDNITGVSGIGEKTAVELMKEFESFDRLYQRLDEVKNAGLRQRLIQHRREAELSRDLVTLHTDAPIRVTPGQIARQEPDRATLLALFKALEFKQLAKTLIETLEPSVSTVTVHDATDPQAWQRCQEGLRSARRVAISLVVAADTNVFEGWALSWEPGEAWWIPDTTERREVLASWCAEGRGEKVGHDVKALLRQLARHHITLWGVAGDTMVAAFLLNPSSTTPTLPDVAHEYLDCVVRADTWQSWGVATEAVLRLSTLLEERLRVAQLDRLYHDVELPLIEVLAAMETAGVAVDAEALQQLGSQMERQLTRLTQQIYDAAGGAFNINSPKQLSTVLFDRLKLPVVKRTKTGASTDTEVLQTLSEHHALPKLLLEYRELAKLKSTYVDTLPALRDPATGRIHTSFHQAVTATGRLSSSDPNMQNIPVKTELGRQIRKAFVPGEKGWQFLSADYSQIELRILAHLSGDEALRQAFSQGHDIHAYTASLIYGTPEAEITPEMRGAAKTVNFGILYGMREYALSKDLGISLEEARAFIEAYFARYPKVRGYVDAQIALARRQGYVTTLLGRRRTIPDINSANVGLRQFAERTAVNTPVQGTAADLIKVAMVRIHRWLATAGLRARMVLQVHDELLFEAPARELEKLSEGVATHMTEALTLEVPVAVTLKTGKNWLEMRELQRQCA